MTVVKSGLLTTVQDAGRRGYQRYGVVVGGAMDDLALRVANLLVGNPPGEAALEITLVGPVLHFHEPALVAVCGADVDMRVSSEFPAEPASEPAANDAGGTRATDIALTWRPVFVEAGTTLSLERIRSGCRAYLAVAGGWAVPSVLGSKSTYLRARLGGLGGRPLADGDTLGWGVPTPWARAWMDALRLLARKGGGPAVPPWSVAAGLRSRPRPVLRFVPGPEWDWFSAAARRSWLAKEFQVTPASDRMGYRLSGPALTLSAPRSMLSEAVTSGTVQVPPDGQPILLMADRQTTGGYPRIAQVIQVDLAAAAQLRPGDRVRFEETSVEEAHRLLREREQALRILAAALRQTRPSGAA